VHKAALGQVFSEYFGSSANHSTNFSIIIITRGWHNMSLVAAVPSGPCIPPPTITIKKKKQPVALANPYLLKVHDFPDLGMSNHPV
jgi:hypothetical protein